ncbi:MAG: type II toxin-antitoxin system RelE/ParE family toxin [Deltaproteobacteria bacterium]|nr:type II toxin-antitoxin system RelE/ParE family toxin [Deltaproteobacteria bacterium]
MEKRCRLRVPEDVRELIRHLHPDLKQKLRAVLDSLLRAPGQGKALRDELRGLRSVRLGRMRLIYRETGEVIELVTFGPRRSIYEDTLRLLVREKNGGGEND